MPTRNMANFTNTFWSAKIRSRDEYIQKDNIEVMRSMSGHQSFIPGMCIYKLLQQYVYTHAAWLCGYLVFFRIDKNQLEI